MDAWFSKANLKKQIALFASIAGVSIGLCGANAALLARYGYISGPNDSTRSAGLSMVLMFTGFCELIGSVIGVVGLIVSVLSLMGFLLYQRYSSSEADD